MPWLPGAIYDDFGYIISAYNISALVFCLYLMAKVRKNYQLNIRTIFYLVNFL